mgnify:CR=1 FL=1
MEENSSATTQGFTLHLQGELAIANAAAVQKQLLQAMQAHQQVTINLSEVRNLDLSCLQLLHAALTMAGKKPVNLQITASLSAEQQQLIQRSGFGYLLHY